MHLHVRPGSGLPIYRQLVEQVERLVATGALAPGDALPSVRELSRELRVNPATVVKAYAELERAGLVETRHGLGSFVSATRTGLQRSERLKLLRESAEALVIQAIHLGCTTDDVHAAVDQVATRVETQKRRSTRER